MKKKVRIQDIADALGISRNTVSKAINNTEGLADETREKILQKAVELGYKQFSYVQNIAEMAVSAASSGTKPGFKGEIALFTSIFINPSHFATLMLDRFQRELLQLGYTLNTHRVDLDNLKNKTLPITFSKERSCALICFEMFNFEYDEMLCELGLPTLFVDGPCRKFGNVLPADQLYMDNTSGISKLVIDMLDAGKKRIGFIGNYEHCESFFERFMAFYGTMMLENVPVNEAWIIKKNHREEMTDALKNMEELPDLFICANDFVAIDAMQVLRNMGKKIPRDVMIAGFDDSVDSRLVDPQLTTIHIHSQIMAYSATQLLISRIEEPSLDYRSVYTETELIYRASAPLNKEQR